MLASCKKTSPPSGAGRASKTRCGRVAEGRRQSPHEGLAVLKTTLEGGAIGVVEVSERQDPGFHSPCYA